MPPWCLWKVGHFASISRSVIHFPSCAPLVALDPSKGLDARAARQTMTIRHLLTHTAGLVYWTPLHDTDALSAAYRVRGITPGNYGAGLIRPGYGPQAVGLDDMVKRLAEVPLAAEPGTVWRYSVGLDVMGLVIQRVTGKPLGWSIRGGASTSSS
ncbi:MAG TPA: serine hydrolase domain-containing protein [Vicinamibacterales bacterium]|nr:serine hydrolase domain-containing protein [Vicinamibacterales bacterium]